MSKFLLLSVCLLSFLLAGCESSMLPANELPKQTHKTHQRSNALTKDRSDRERGYQYLLGQGVLPNDTQAASFFKRAAKEGDALSQNQLAYLYARGRGVPKDYEQALHYYLLAANQGLATAQYNAGFFYLHGLGTTKNTALAKEWFLRAKAHGFEPAKVALERINP